MRKIIGVGGMMVLILVCTLWGLSPAAEEQNEFWSQSFREFLEKYHVKKETLTEEAFEQWKNNCKGKKVRWKGWIEEICHDYYLNEYRIKIQTHWGISIETNRPEEALSGWRMIAHIPEWRASEVQRLKIDQKVGIVAIIEGIHYNYEVVVKNARFLKPQEVGEVENKLVKSLEFTTIEKGFFSGFTERKKWIIKTQEQWLKSWNMHTSTRIPHPAPPAIDFTKDMILAVFIWQRPSGGFSVEIIRVEKVEDTIVVFFRETEPSPDAMVTAVLTQPYHIIRIKKTDLPVIFKNVEEENK